MTWVEFADAIWRFLGPLVGAAVTLGVTKRKARAEEAVAASEADAEERTAEADERVAELERDGLTTPTLLARIETLEARADRCDRQNRALRKRHAREREDDKKACDAKVDAAVRKVRDEMIVDIGQVGEVVEKHLIEKARREGRDAREDTGLHRLAPVLGKRPSDPAMRAVQELPPAPKREPKP